MRSQYYCLFAPRIYGCYSSRTSRSWWIAYSMQRQSRGCNNIPSFLQRTAPIARSLCEGCTWHDLHILVTVPFCCDRKARAASAQSFTLWQQATRDHPTRSLYYCLFAPRIYGGYSSCTSRSCWIAHSTQCQPRGCNSVYVYFEVTCVTCVKMFVISIYFILFQKCSVGAGSPNYGPRATSGPRSHFIRPAKTFCKRWKKHLFIWCLVQ